MLFVLLTILSSLSISLILKFNETRDGNRLVVAGSNYISAALLSLLMSEGTFNLSGTGLGLGIAAGGGFVVGVLLLMRSIREAGLAITISVARIAMLGPVLLSTLVYKEYPGPVEIVGIIIGLAAFILLGNAQRKPEENLRPNISTFLLLSLLFAVMVFNDFAMKVVQVNRIDKEGLLLLLFSTAGLICWGSIAGRMVGKRDSSNGKIKRRDIAIGLLLGVPNFFSSYFLILALQELPTSSVFPVISAAGVILTTFAALIIWKERPSPLAWLGITLAAIAVTLLG